MLHAAQLHLHAVPHQQEHGSLLRTALWAVALHSHSMACAAASGGRPPAACPSSRSHGTGCSGPVWSGLVWSGLVWSGLVWMLWSGLVYLEGACGCAVPPAPWQPPHPPILATVNLQQSSSPTGPAAAARCTPAGQRQGRGLRCLRPGWPQLAQRAAAVGQGV